MMADRCIIKMEMKFMKEKKNFELGDRDFGCEQYDGLAFETVELVEEETISLACWRSAPSSC